MDRLVEVHWAPRARGLRDARSADDLVGVAVLSDAPAAVRRAARRVPARCAERLAGRRVTPACRGAGPLRQRSARRVAGRVLLVGDAAGYVDALTGEGIALGLAQARAAVAAVAAGRPRPLRAGLAPARPGATTC